MGLERIETAIKVLASTHVPPIMAQVTKVLVAGIPAYVRENVRAVPDPDHPDGAPLSENILELLAPAESWTKISTVIALEDDQKRSVHPAPADFTYEWVFRILDDGPDRGERAELSQALQIIHELLKDGAHDGPCNNEEDEHDSCSLHIEASERRKEAAQAFLMSVCDKQP